jgi:hypothetical protein
MVLRSRGSGQVVLMWHVPLLRMEGVFPLGEEAVGVSSADFTFE